MREIIFRIILPAVLILFIAHRGYYSRKFRYSEENTLKQRKESLGSRIGGVVSIMGLVATLLYVVSPNWISWAFLPLPIWLRWTGVGIVILGFVLLQWAQTTLGKNWSDQPRMIRAQNLVTSGPYRRIRHPIYTAFLMILGSTLLISSNWLIGISWAGMTTLEIASRIRFEESLMLEYFGDQYREYMKMTGRLLPRLVR